MRRATSSALVRYEAMRAGLDPHMVLAVIDVESQFRKYAVSKAGARGFMQVMPFWVKEIGEPGHNLFHERMNLRYGCTILRHYLDRENGNLVQRARPLQRLARPGRVSRTACSRPSRRAGRWALAAMALRLSVRFCLVTSSRNFFVTVPRRS